ncbi:MAG: PaREP1 family protein [Sulfolobales archaeon]
MTDLYSEELLEEVRRRMGIVEIYFKNYQEYLDRREFEKASEMLWGILNNLASMLSMLYGGEPIRKHDELRMFMNVLAQRIREPEILRLYRSCEKLHANFFHSFMDEIDFEECRIDAEKLIDILQKLVYRELGNI